jgi:hypothetical protein
MMKTEKIRREYNVGDRVITIKGSDVKPEMGPDLPLEEMKDYCGKSAIVERKYESAGKETLYELDIDSGLYGWTSALLEPEIRYIKRFEVGDVVKIIFPATSENPYIREDIDKWYVYLRDSQGKVVRGSDTYEEMCFNRDMDTYSGKTAIIKEVDYIKSSSVRSYRIDLDGHLWNWVGEFFCDGECIGDFYDTLVGKPKGTKLYSPAYGKLELMLLDNTEREIITIDKDGELRVFMANGNLGKYGEPMLKLEI